MLPVSAAAAAGACEVEVELTGLFRPANRLDDGAGTDAPTSPLVAVVLGVCLVELVPFSVAFAALANNPPALVAAGVAVDVSAVEAPKSLNKLGVPVPAVVVVGVDDGCVVAAGVEVGKLNVGLGSAEDEVTLPSGLNKDELVPWDVAVAPVLMSPGFAKWLEVCAAALGGACCEGCDVSAVAAGDTVAGVDEAAAVFSCVLPRFPKSPPAGFDAALMLKRPVPEFVLAFENRLDDGAAVDVDPVVSAGLLDPNKPPEVGCDMLPNRLVGAVVPDVSWADDDADFALLKVLVGCC